MAQKQHVIPHNIMDVDFKLFGVMNLKQFIYVAIGAVLTYITFLSMRDGAIPAVFGWPAIFFFVVFGISFGLIPVRGRSLDQWVLSYIAAVRSPTKRAWMKKGITPDAIPSTIPLEQLKPAQVRLGTEATVSQIIGGLHIPTPEVDVSQQPFINRDNAQVVSMEGRQTLMAQMQGQPGPEVGQVQQVAQAEVSEAQTPIGQPIDPSTPQVAEQYTQQRFDTMTTHQQQPEQQVNPPAPDLNNQ